MKFFNYSAPFLTSILLLAGCSQLSEPVSPQPLNKVVHADVLECKPIFKDACSNMGHCHEVIVGFNCTNSDDVGGGAESPLKYYTYSSFRTRGFGGSLNFNVTYYRGGVAAINSTRQTSTGSTVDYVFDGFTVSSEAGDNSFDFIAYVTFTDTSLATSDPTREKKYRMFISYDASNPQNIATITNYELY